MSTLEVDAIKDKTGTKTLAALTSSSVTLDSGVLFPSGHIIQSKFYQWALDDSSTVTANFTKHNDFVTTITPEYATSSIWVYASVTVHQGSGYCVLDFYKNASDFTETANTSGLTSWGRAVSHINGSWQNVAYSWLDPMTENSVTEKTYAVSYRATAGSIQVGFGTGQYSTMVLMEIAV